MLDKLEPEKILKEIPQLENIGQNVSRSIHDWVLEGNESKRDAVDLLHGTWLGHPFHPVMTDITIGAWLFGYFFDLVSLVSRSKGTQQTADILLNIGNASAVVTALAGLADYSTAPPRVMATGAAHGLLNTLGLVSNLLSAKYRKKGKRAAGFMLSSISANILLISAWLGGEMVYKYKIGVDKSIKPPEPKRWHPTISDQELPEMTPMRVEVEGSPILLYRYLGQIYAIGTVCAHESGPLEEGSFDGFCVTCPWHQSVYDLRDGSVVHGPTTYAEPAYEVRVEQGRIEVRLKEKPEMEPLPQEEQAPGI